MRTEELMRLADKYARARAFLTHGEADAARAALQSAIERLAAPAEPQMPILRVKVDDGVPVSSEFYAPGLPDGEHDLFCAPCDPRGSWQPSMFSGEQTEHENPPVAYLYQHDETGRTVLMMADEGNPGDRYTFRLPLYAGPREHRMNAAAGT